MRDARRPVQKSTPLTLQHKRRPEIRMAPAFLLRDALLSLFQSLSRTFPVRKHLVIELGHQLGGRSIVHFPETRHYARRSRMHETTGERDESFAPDLFADT